VQPARFTILLAFPKSQILGSFHTLCFKVGKWNPLFIYSADLDVELNA